jgi:2'-5' RNA ligase
MGEARLLTVMANPVEVPAEVDRSGWPVHVTVAGNFRVDGAQIETISALVAGVAAGVDAFAVHLGPEAQFGPEHSIPVLLADHPTFHRLHERMAAGLARLPGFIAADPLYWGGGYRPHATLGSVVRVREGSTLSMKVLTLASLEEQTGRSVSTVVLG